MIFRLFLLLMSVMTATTAIAAEVDVQVSSRETYVGLPITLQIRIANASKHEPPELPEVDGLEIQSLGRPTQSSRMTINNGQVSSSSSLVYQYSVTPTREGNFTIPPVKVVADSLATITKAIRLIVSKSETGDLLFVEVAGKQKEIFVGQPLDLTLHLWIRPYRDTENRISLRESDIWNCITNDSKWGSFVDRMKELAANDQRPKGNLVLREDNEGNEHEYWLFEIDATIYPTRPGEIKGDDVRIVVNYPTETKRRRSSFPSIFEDSGFPFGGQMFEDSFFGSRSPVTKVRPVVAEATVEPIVVKPIPKQGRPDSYRGAVGKYSIVTEASPTTVKAGEPITLQIAIDGDGPMELVRAPALQSQHDLVSNFKVADDSLSGFVKDDRKYFSTTIRPIQAGVSEIPGIEFSYFDPTQEHFVTTRSAPIPITVEKAEVLSLDTIVDGRRSTSPSQPSVSPAQTRTDAASLALGDDLLVSQPRGRLLSKSTLGMLTIPPLAALLVLMFSRRSILSRFVSTHRRLRQRLLCSESSADVAGAVEEYLADRFRLQPDDARRSKILGQLRTRGLSELAIRVERLFAQTNKPSFAASGSLDHWKEEARAIAKRLQRRSGAPNRNACPVQFEPPLRRAQVPSKVNSQQR